MNVVAILQARMGSTRLPGKVLKDIAGCTMLGHCIRRARLAKQIDLVAVATSTSADDQAVVDEAGRLEAPCIRGSELDVLDRYYQAAAAMEADLVVRITSDCPLLDPVEVDRVVAALVDSDADYASNTLERTLPRGLDAEAMTLATLHRAWEEAQEHYERVHVTPYIRENPDRFTHISVTSNNQLGDMRWTVDTAEDLDLVRHIFGAFQGRSEPSWQEVLSLLESHPEWVSINRNVRQKDVKEG
jgi:spore coat polysaccharide biosynthesis protein SpsF